MRRRLLAWGLMLAGVLCLAQQSPAWGAQYKPQSYKHAKVKQQHAHVELRRAYWQTRDSAYNNPPASGGGSFVGPGDLKSYLAWAGFSCYTAAFNGNVFSIWDAATGVTSHTIGTCSGGTLIVSSPTPLATTCASGCELEWLYDPTGLNSCGGAPCDLGGGAHNSHRPVVLLNAINGTPCVTIGGGNYLTTTNNFTQTQPFSAAIVAQRTGNTGAITSAFGGANAIRIGYANAANTTMLYVGGSITNGPSASDAAMHAIGYVANNASSLIGVDATSASTVNIGSSAGFSAVTLQVGQSNGGTSFTGTFCEGGIANATWSAADIQAVNANAHARYGGW